MPANSEKAMPVNSKMEKEIWPDNTPTSSRREPILCRLGDAEFDNGLGRNLDLLLRRLWIKTCARLSLLLH